MARTKAAAQRTITLRPVAKKIVAGPSSPLPLHELIRKQREDKGYSPSDLARKLGITTESLHDIENYRDEIDDAPVWLARKLAALLDIQPERFFANS